jgi:hypothetical protein
MKIINHKTMKKLLSIILLICIVYCHAQDNTFIYLSIGGNDNAIVNKTAIEQNNKPLLIYNDKIYVVGGDCISEALKGGDINDRNKGGDKGNRNKGGDMDSRNRGGDKGNRNKGGDMDSRKKGGDMDSRNKGGDMSSRQKNGDLNSRNKSSDVLGQSCEIDDNGKLIIYTFLKISAKKSKIYYNGNYFNKKFFKIIKI